MLQTLLSPLRSRFDLSPKTPTTAQSPKEHEQTQSPEDFARDVMVELMRSAVENLKRADSERAKCEVLVEIQRIMLQDEVTKNVFREMDGFLVLMSVLSTIQDHHQDDDHTAAIETTRLVFVVLAEAMTDHSENSDFFRNRLGYESLGIALQGLVSDPKTVDETMGFLLSLALSDFSLSGLFTSIRGAQGDDLEVRLAEFQSRLGTIHRPEVIRILWDLAFRDTTSIRYGMFKLFEELFYVSHRNQGVLSGLGLVKSVFTRFIETRGDESVSEKERLVLQKVLRRLLDMGATTSEARRIFQQAVKGDETLDGEMLDVIRFGMKSRWLQHFSMESSAALVVSDDKFKGLPAGGLTVMMWIWVAGLPKRGNYALFTVEVPTRVLLQLSLRPDGKLELLSSGNAEAAIFASTTLRKSRWTHIALVHYPVRGINPCIRLFVDGALCDMLSWSYPKPESSCQKGTYTIGDTSEAAQMSWCLASAYLLATPLGDDLPRLVHHLGPRYSGPFQDPTLIKFLTYDASTSLNMFLTNATKTSDVSPLMKAVKNGLGVPESLFIFSLSASDCTASGQNTVVPVKGLLKEVESRGNVFTVKATTLDMALWKIGGAAVALRLVQLAQTPHEISRTLGILMDGLKNNWQNSEDMERLRGYEILADILRGKAQAINLTAFETLFEFLGLNFSSPEYSTVTNLVAYKAIALDFELWSRSRKEIQRSHLEHFTILVQTSRYRAFNVKQRMAKMGLVRKLLFALQAEWYSQETLPYAIEALKVTSQANFTKDDTIKPLVSYLAANLHEGQSDSTSPHSILSRFEFKNPREKAEQILELLISTLAIPTHYAKFVAALPLTRICLLLLGDHPSPLVATQILRLIGISIDMSSSFSRKFELVVGWSVLKTVLPSCWNPAVNEAVFNLLLGRLDKKAIERRDDVVSCPPIVPTILSALHSGLVSVAANCHADEASHQLSWETETTMEILVEDMMSLHASSATFREIFRSQQTTQLFIEAYKAYVSKLSSANHINQWNTRILDKVTHFALALALDNAVAGQQKRDILNTIQSAEIILNPAADKTLIDPSLIHMSDSRTARQRIASARFSMQVGERTVIKAITRMGEWRRTIQVSEKKRLRKTILDLREHRRQVSRLQEWTNLLTSERGLWPHPEPRLWRLDETEGPHRIRKKLEPQNDKNPSSRVDALEQGIRDVQQPDSDSNSVIQAEVPPWAESYEISSTDMEERQLAEDIVDDKLRRVRHELEPGDVIEAVGTVARVVGVDSSPGLLIIGRTHIYMLDGVVENDEGEVIDAHDAPKRLLFIPGSLVELDGPQRAQRWAHHQISTCSDKKFLFRDVALEIYFKDSRSLLLVFLDKKRRQDMDQHLYAIINRNSSDPGLSSAPLRTPLYRMGSRMLSTFRADELSSATRKWQAREISNYTYLSILNQISGRTPSDATQYPVFPWVLSDYTSQTLDLTSPDSYRDLTKPMGALTPAQREAAETKYENLKSVGEEPFHYGTHFSSSMIVCHFLIRLAPFTNMFKTLQGGDWDLPDRLFSDLPRAYLSAAEDVRGDVRELIPEFFTCPEFLENSQNLDFGVQQQTGERIHDVKLPPWARQDPLLFIVMNRRALESSYVSEHLPAWIDLIWGYNQRDAASLNVFHPLSYEGSIDLDNIEDDLEREATVGIIHNFGQTPRKLFTAPHPERFHHGLVTLPIGTLHGIEEDPHLLVQAPRCFKDLGPTVAVRELVLDPISERMVPCPEGVLCVPQYPLEQVEWRPGSTELRVVVDNKVVQVVENAFCNCATFADSANLITGSSDYTVRLWKVSRPNGGSSGGIHISLSNIMRIHTDEVVCVAASRAWSLVVSGSKDGSAAIWDLNRGMYVRSIWHGEGGESTTVNLVAINESTGYIATCSRLKLCLHTINAQHIATLDLTTTPSYSRLVPTITAMAFHERDYSYLGVLATGGPDGTITLRTWTADGTPEGEKAQWEFLAIRTMKARMGGRGIHRPPSITALKFLGELMYHGEETGKSFVWTFPE